MKRSQQILCNQEITKDPDLLYRKFFECFNQGLFFEAHEVLETVWLPVRQGADGAFYKGLIQIAGAFVHLQKERPGPAAALLRLAQKNLAAYTPSHKGINVEQVQSQIAAWLKSLVSAHNPLRSNPFPILDPPTMGG